MDDKPIQQESLITHKTYTSVLRQYNKNAQ